MIHALRTRHRRVAAFWLALLVPVGFIAGIAARRAIPAAKELPVGLVGDIGRPVGSVREASLTLQGVTVELRAWGVGAEQYVELAPTDDIERPDVLVYWSAAPLLDEGEALPADAVLVGRLAGARRRRFALPAGAEDGGQLAFYSLAHNQSVGHATLPGGL